VHSKYSTFIAYIKEYSMRQRSRHSDLLLATGIESLWGRYIRHPPRTAQEPIQLTLKWISCLLPEGKAAGAWRWPPISI